MQFTSCLVPPYWSGFEASHRILVPMSAKKLIDRTPVALRRPAGTLFTSEELLNALLADLFEFGGRSLVVAKSWNEFRRDAAARDAEDTQRASDESLTNGDRLAHAHVPSRFHRLAVDFHAAGAASGRG